MDTEVLFCAACGGKMSKLDDFLAAGGKITQVDSSHNKDAGLRFRDTNAGPRYVDKKEAQSRMNLHNNKNRDK